MKVQSINILFDSLRKRIFEQKDLLSIKYIAVSNYQDTFEEIIDDSPINIRSISKTFVALCFGIMSDIYPNVMSTDLKIYPLLKDKIGLKTSSNYGRLSNLTFFHLLTQTTGFIDDHLLRTGSLNGDTESSFLDRVINSPIETEPGERFVYSNASAYLMSVLYQVIQNENLSDFAYKSIFAPLNISGFSWQSWDGYCAGATGLHLKPSDLHKVSRLLLQNGSWNNQQIIPAHYVHEMLSAQVEIDTLKYSNPLHPIAYGYFTWIAKSHLVYASGANGKFIIIAPDKSIVITVVADTQNSNLILESIGSLMI